ncbi:MAG TPA: Imm9 family immunity protein [Hanamia sp.]|nr:Imm9 family immunity protein [Hanamia sp.]
MHVKIRNSSMIMDFLDIGFDSSKICQLVEFDANKIVNKINLKDLQDWSLHFVFNYTNGTEILISKRTKSVSSIKYKDIVAHIPIPEKNKIFWGVESSQQIYKDPEYLNNIIQNFDCLKVDFTKYKNREDYILDSMLRVIDFSFKKGFTINGIKVKLKDS